VRRCGDSKELLLTINDCYLLHLRRTRIAHVVKSSAWKNGYHPTARPADTYALARNAWVTVVDREYPLVLAASGPPVVRSSESFWRDQLFRRMFHAAGQLARAQVGRRSRRP
jgi:hypothetical protein